MLFIQYIPEVPEFLCLHLAAVKQKKAMHLLPPWQQQQLREDIAARPFCEVRRDIPRSNPKHVEITQLSTELCHQVPGKY